MPGAGKAEIRRVTADGTTHGEQFSTCDAMRQAVFEYIEVDYNRTRRHSANGFISPIAFEAQQVA